MANVSERWAELKSQFVAWVAEGAKDLHNHIVPAFPTYHHGVDQPGTPLNMSPEPASKPSFEEVIAKQAPAKAPEPSPDRGIEL